MNEQDEEPLAEWLFYARKHQRRHRTTHTTHSSTTNTEDKN